MATDESSKRYRSYLLNQALRRLSRREYTPESLHQAVLRGAQQAINRRSYQIMVQSEDDHPRFTKEHPLDGLDPAKLPDFVEQTVAHCVANNWCCRDRAIDAVIESGHRRSLSRLQIQARLIAEGVDIDSLNHQLATEDDEVRAATKIIKKHILRSLKSPGLSAAGFPASDDSDDDENHTDISSIRQQAFNVLARRGFPADIIQTALKQLKDKTLE